MDYSITDLMKAASMMSKKYFGRQNEYTISFTKEDDGCWYVDYPDWPFDHHNLMMVAGANMLCEYVAEKEGHPDYAEVDVTTGDNHLDGRTPDIVMSRCKTGYGATYHNTMPDGLPPFVIREGRMILVPDAWLCPVTILVLHRYPKRINLYIKQ